MQAWTDYNEPIRLPVRTQALGPLTLYQMITGQEVRRLSHNNAPRWLVLSVGEVAAARAAGLSPEEMLQPLAAAEPMSLAELAAVPPTFMLPEDQANLVRDTASALVLYLEENVEPDGVRRLLQRLADHPADPRGAGPDVEPSRGALALQALAQVTGRSAAELEHDFRTWWARLAAASRRCSPSSRAWTVPPQARCGPPASN